jgi:NADH-quinone oxidoreductase subunit C
MTPEEVGAALVAALGAEEPSEDAVPVATVSGGDQWARATVDVPPGQWTTAVRTARDRLGCDFFDWLSAVDELERGYAVVAHLWSTGQRHGVLVRTRVPRENPALDTIVDLFPGAAWHERETHEMFGVDFRGHPNLTPLLLPPEFEGHPLRKDFVLATRVAKPWPGAKEPGESHAEGTARRQPMRPPGVPAPGEWTMAGPGAAGAEAGSARGGRAARPDAGARPPRRRPGADTETTAPDLATDSDTEE